MRGWCIFKASRQASSSPLMLRRGVSTAILSASPSKPKPRATPSCFIAALRSAKLFSSLGSGWWFGKLPSGCGNKTLAFSPSLSMILVAVTPAAPFAQSMIKGAAKPLRAANSFSKYARYSLKMSYFSALASVGISKFEPISSRTCAPRRFKSAPKKLSVPIVILKPL